MSTPTRLLSTSWAWYCDGQPPIAITCADMDRRTIVPRRLTVTRWADGCTHVMVEGPVLKRGKTQPGRRAAGRVDPASPSCPAWIAQMAASVIGALDEAIS